MGSTLTNTQPKDTYKGILKTSDTTELSATAKYVSDGNGNDSALALSTSAVGIGTSSPEAKLQVTTAASAANEVGLRLNNPNGNVAPTGVDIVFQSGYTTGIDGAAIIRGGRNSAATDSYISFETNTGSALTEKLRITPSGNVGIGTSTPTQNLQVYQTGTAGNNYNEGRIQVGGSSSVLGLSLSYNGQSSGVSSISGLNNAGGENSNINIGFGEITSGGVPTNNLVTITQGGYFRLNSGSGGIQFNGDTAAANALDDYEEGTWTPQIYYQNSTDQANSTNVTQVGTYTKIGRQVKVSGTLQWTITGSPAVDNIGIKNFPFTSINSSNYFSFGQMQVAGADSYPALTLDIFINENSTVAIFSTPTATSNQGANIGSTGTKTARFEMTYFV